MTEAAVLSALAALQPLPSGLVAVTGDEGRGKTTVLRQLAGDLPPLPGQATGVQGLWLDLRLPHQDDRTPVQVWQSLRERAAGWNDELLQELVDALGLREHEAKQLFMLSAGSRRKVGIAGLLAAGAPVTCLDQPFAALDQASIRVIREFLADMADHPARTWVVADYEADPQLPWRHVVSLD